MFKRARSVQYYSAVLASATAIGNGMLNAWTSPTLPILQSKDTPLDKPLDEVEISWLLSIGQFSAVIAGIFVPFSLKRLGRKGTLIVSCILQIIPWLFILFATNVYYLYISKIFASLAMVLSSGAIVIYIGEISEDDIRGRLGSLFGLLMVVGGSFTLIVGPYTNYASLAIIGLLIPLILLNLLRLIPESPYFYIKCNRRDKACKALTILLGNDDAIDNIVEEINNEEKVGSLKEFFAHKHYVKIFGVMIVVKSIQFLAGTPALEPYMQSLLAASEGSISPQLSSVLLGLIQFPSSLLSLLLIDNMGRKPTLIITCLGSATALTTLGFYFYLKHFQLDDYITSLGWLPTASVILFQLSVSFGMLLVPFLLSTELFPSNFKETVVTILNAYVHLFSGIVANCFLPFTNLVGFYTVLWIFALCCVLIALFTFVFVPETKKKSFGEIQRKINISVISK